MLYFRWGDGADDEALYLTSADWMSRNMFRRIEIAWPVREPALRQRLIDECLVPYLLDGKDAWLEQSDGSYVPVGAEGAERPAGADASGCRAAAEARFQWRLTRARVMP